MRVVDLGGVLLRSGRAPPWVASFNVSSITSSSLQEGCALFDPRKSKLFPTTMEGLAKASPLSAGTLNGTGVSILPHADSLALYDVREFSLLSENSNAAVLSFEQPDRFDKYRR